MNEWIKPITWTSIEKLDSCNLVLDDLVVLRFSLTTLQLNGRNLICVIISKLDPLGLVIERLSIRRPKQRVKAKILELGLVDDVKQLRKKRPANERKKKSKRSANDDFVEEDVEHDGAEREMGNFSVHLCSPQLARPECGWHCY